MRKLSSLFQFTPKNELGPTEVFYKDLLDRLLLDADEQPYERHSGTYSDIRAAFQRLANDCRWTPRKREPGPYARLMASPGGLIEKAVHLPERSRSSDYTANAFKNDSGAEILFTHYVRGRTRGFSLALLSTPEKQETQGEVVFALNGVLKGHVTYDEDGNYTGDGKIAVQGLYMPAYTGKNRGHDIERRKITRENVDRAVYFAEHAMKRVIEGEKLNTLIVRGILASREEAEEDAKKTAAPAPSSEQPSSKAAP